MKKIIIILLATLSISVDAQVPYCLCRGYNGETFSELGKGQGFIDRHYGDLGLTTNDTRGLAEILKCLYKTDKPLMFFEDIGINRGVNLSLKPQTPWRRKMIYGFMHRLYTTNNDTFALIYSEVPTTVQQAEQMADRVLVVMDVQFSGTHNQTAMDIGAGIGHYNERCEYYNLRMGNDVKFSMQGTEVRPIFWFCDTGMNVGVYQNLPANKAQSNNFSVIKPRYKYGGGNHNGMAIMVRGSENVVIDNLVSEGNDSTQSIIDFDDQGASSVNHFWVYRLYQEHGLGTSEGAIRLKMRDGTFVLDGALGHGNPGVSIGSWLVNAKATSQSTNIIIRDVNYWCGKGGKLFANSPGPNNPAWQFDLDKFSISSNHKNLGQLLFTDPASIEFCGEPYGANGNCGYGRYGTVTPPQ